MEDFIFNEDGTINLPMSPEFKAFSNTVDEVVSLEGLIIFCQNPYSRDIINKEYETNDKNYYNYRFKEMRDDYSLRKNMLDIEEEAAWYKLTGILEYNIKHDGPDFRKVLLQKTYKWIYRIIQSAPHCDVTAILSKYLKDKKMKKMKARELTEIIVAALQIAAIEDKPVLFGTKEFIMDVCDVSLSKIVRARALYPTGSKKNRLYDTIPPEILNTKKFNTLWSVINHIEVDAIKDPVMADSMAYYLQFANAIGMDDFSMTNVDYLPRDVEIITHFLNRDKTYILTEDSKKAIVSALFLILALKKKYEKAKDYSLNKETVREHEKIIGILENHVQERDMLLDELKKMEGKIENLNNQLNHMKSKNETCNKNIRLLEDALIQTTNNNKEVNALREALYNIEIDETPAGNGDTYIEKTMQFVKKNKIAIVGGTEQWSNENQRALPGVKFLKDNSKNLNLTYLKSYDLVLINTKNLSHSMYYKIVELIRDTDTKLGYVTQNKQLLVQIFNESDKLY